MSIPSAAVAVAVCIYKGVIDHCDPAAGPIEACRSCHDAASSALRLTRFACPSSSAFRGKKYTDKTAKERSTPIATGSGLNRGALKGVPVGVTQELNASHMGISNPPKVAPYFPVGAIVDVEPRTGLNQNKEGGRVRVTKVNGGKHGVPCAASGGGGKGLPLVPLFNPDDKNTRNQRPSSSSPSKERWGLFVVTYGVISAVVVVVAAVADSAVSWHYRWPGGLWRPLLGLPEHAEPRWCYEVRVAAVGAGICPPLSTNFCSNEGSAASMFEGRGSGERLALSGSEGALIERLQEDDETATGR